MELATTDMILPAVRHNLGIGFIPPEFAKDDLESGEVFEIEVKETFPQRNIILIYDTEYPQSIAAKAFLRSSSRHDIKNLQRQHISGDIYKSVN